MQPVERDGQASWRRLRRMPRGSRDADRGGGRRDHADRREQLRNRPVLALGPVDPDRDPGGRDEQREDDPEVDVGTAEGRRSPERHDRAELEEPSKRVDRRRLLEVDRDHDQASTDVTANALVTERRDAPARRTAGRAMNRRRTIRPIELITVRKDEPLRDDQLGRRRRPGYVGDRELRRRARVRPDGERERALHRMSVDRDRAPVDEVPALRQLRLQLDDRACPDPRASEQARWSPPGGPARW